MVAFTTTIVIIWFHCFDFVEGYLVNGEIDFKLCEWIEYLRNNEPSEIIK